MVQSHIKEGCLRNLGLALSPASLATELWVPKEFWLESLIQNKQTNKKTWSIRPNSMNRTDKFLVPSPSHMSFWIIPRPPSPALRLMKHKAAYVRIWTNRSTKHIFNAVDFLMEFLLWWVNRSLCSIKERKRMEPRAFIIAAVSIPLLHILELIHSMGLLLVQHQSGYWRNNKELDKVPVPMELMFCWQEDGWDNDTTKYWPSVLGRN